MATYDAIVRWNVTNFALVLKPEVAMSVFETFPRLATSPVVRLSPCGGFHFRTEPWLLHLLEYHASKSGDTVLAEATARARRRVRRAIAEELFPHLCQIRSRYRNSDGRKARRSRIEGLMAIVHQGIIRNATGYDPNMISAMPQATIEFAKVVDALNDTLASAGMGAVKLDYGERQRDDILRLQIEAGARSKLLAVRLDWGAGTAGSATINGINLCPCFGLLQSNPVLSLDGISSFLHELGHVLGSMLEPKSGAPSDKVLDELPARCLEQLSLMPRFCASISAGSVGLPYRNHLCALAAYRARLDLAIAEFDLRWHFALDEDEISCLRSLSPMAKSHFAATLNDKEEEDTPVGILLNLPHIFSEQYNYGGRYYWYPAMEWLIAERISDLASKPEGKLANFISTAAKRGVEPTLMDWMNQSGCGAFTDLIRFNHHEN